MNAIQEGILAEFLTQNRAEAKQVSIYEYDEEKHMRQSGKRPGKRMDNWQNGTPKGTNSKEIVKRNVGFLRLQ